MDGKKINAIAVHADSNILSYMKIKKHGTRIKKCDLSNVYSVVYKNSTEKIYYTQNIVTDKHYMAVDEKQNLVLDANNIISPLRP